MSDNTQLPAAGGGDTIRTIDRGFYKTQVIGIDAGGEAGPESLVTPANGLPIVPATGATFSISSAASLPLPANAVQETGGNLDAISARQARELVAVTATAQLTMAQGPGFVPVEIPAFLIGY